MCTKCTDDLTQKTKYPDYRSKEPKMPGVQLIRYVQLVRIDTTTRKGAGKIRQDL